LSAWFPSSFLILASLILASYPGRRGSTASWSFGRFVQAAPATAPLVQARVSPLRTTAWSLSCRRGTLQRGVALIPWPPGLGGLRRQPRLPSPIRAEPVDGRRLQPEQHRPRPGAGREVPGKRRGERNVEGERPHLDAPVPALPRNSARPASVSTLAAAARAAWSISRRRRATTVCRSSVISWLA
jgi:hypothetical protein